MFLHLRFVFFGVGIDQLVGRVFSVRLLQTTRTCTQSEHLGPGAYNQQFKPG